MQTEQLLCWSGMTDTEHSTTSSSNEEGERSKINAKVVQYYHLNGNNFLSVRRCGSYF